MKQLTIVLLLLFILAILKYPLITLPTVFIILAYLVGMMVKNNEGNPLI